MSTPKIGNESGSKLERIGLGHTDLITAVVVLRLVYHGVWVVLLDKLLGQPYSLGYLVSALGTDLAAALIARRLYTRIVNTLRRNLLDLIRESKHD